MRDAHICCSIVVGSWPACEARQMAVESCLNTYRSESCKRYRSHDYCSKSGRGCDRACHFKATDMTGRVPSTHATVVLPHKQIELSGALVASFCFGVLLPKLQRTYVVRARRQC